MATRKFAGLILFAASIASQAWAQVPMPAESNVAMASTGAIASASSTLGRTCVTDTYHDSGFGPLTYSAHCNPPAAVRPVEPRVLAVDRIRWRGAAPLGTIPSVYGSERLQMGITTASPADGTFEMTVSPCKGVIDPGAGFCYKQGVPSASVYSIEWSPNTIPGGFPACKVDGTKTNYLNIRYNYSNCPFGSCDYAINVTAGSLPPP